MLPQTDTCSSQDISGSWQSGWAQRRAQRFWLFWRLVEGLAVEGRAPTPIAVENVRALLTSNRGADTRAIMCAMAAIGYQVGAVILDAAHFLPQSRERVFIIGVRHDAPIPEDLLTDCPDPRLHPAALCRAVAGLPHLWWRLPPFPTRALQLADILEGDRAVTWHAPEETERLRSLLASPHAAKLAEARQTGTRMVMAGFKRGRPRQQLELRFDGLAGALRTAVGGSSRQLLVVIEPDGAIRSRLISPREAARLMGLPESYRLPSNLNEALSLCGDGVCIPVVRFLSESLLAPLVRLPALLPETY